MLENYNDSKDKALPVWLGVADVFPVLGTRNSDWMKDPSAFTISRKTLVECCFISYD